MIFAFKSTIVISDLKHCMSVIDPMRRNSLLLSILAKTVILTLTEICDKLERFMYYINYWNVQNVQQMLLYFVNMLKNVI